MIEKLRQSDIIKILILFLLSFVFMIVFSFTTSPLNPYMYQYDSAYFQSVGKAMAKGMLPYRDFFDNKGPLLFTINAIAYMTPFPRYTLLILQSIAMGTWLSLIFFSLKKFFTVKETLFIVIATVLFFSAMINGGNYTEEYSVAFTFYALCNEAEWFRAKDKDRHPLSLAAMDGVMIGLISLMVVKNSVMLCCIVFSYCLYLAIKGNWKNLFENICCLALSYGIVIGFTCLVLKRCGILNDCIYATLTYNFSYIAATSSDVSLSAKIIVFLLPEILMFCCGIFKFFEKEYLASFTLVFSAVAMSCLFINSSQYKHYFMLGIPCIYLAVMLKGRIRWLSVEALIMFLCIIVGLGYSKNQLSTYSENSIEMTKSYNESVIALIDKVPEEERGEIATYNLTGGQVCFYAIADILPIQRHCYLTEMHDSTDDKISDEYLNFLKNNRPKWLVMPDSSTDQKIREYVDKNYEMIADSICYINLSMMVDDDRLMLYMAK